MSAIDLAKEWGSAVAALVSTTTLGVLLRAWLQNRRIALDSRRITVDENHGLRAEFIQEMRDLRDEVKSLRAENADLRAEIRTLHDVIDGLRKGDLQASLSAQRVIAGTLDVSPPVRRALNTLDNLPGQAKDGSAT